MSGSILQELLATPWSLAVGVFFLGLAVFVHELGHFLAARWRGVHATRFSIGFGPKIFSWTDRHGTEWRLSWILLGGYVALPQLADMGQLEGGEGGEARNLPSIGYLDKVIVSVAGAVFNLLFAFLLATILWQMGERVSATSQTTQIGYVAPTIDLPGGRKVTSPAREAGLRPGDVVRSIDGRRVTEWEDIVQSLIMGAGVDAEGRRAAVFVIERDGRSETVTVHPQLATEDKIRRIGIAPAGKVIVHGIVPDKAAAQAGLQKGDILRAVDNTPILGPAALEPFLEADNPQPLRLTIERGSLLTDIALPAGAIGRGAANLGVQWTVEYRTIHTPPHRQLVTHVTNTFRTLWSLVHPHSDIGLSKVSGAVGMIAVFAQASIAGIRAILWVTILVNIALAVFNLLPIPVLDGGHVLFATISTIRGRPLPFNIVASTQSVFVVLLVSMMIYVNFFDVRRVVRDNRPPEEKSAPAQPAPAQP